MPRRPSVVIATLAAAVAATVGVAGFAAASEATPAPTATAARVSFESFEAHPAANGRVKLEVRTSPATKVAFRYRGATFTARPNGDDNGDDNGEFKRTVRRRGGDSTGDRIVVRVRACDGSGCRSKTFRPVIRSDDAGDDNGGGGGGGSDD